MKMAWYAETVRVGTVPPTVFWPVPNVDSGLVSIARRPAAGDHDQSGKCVHIIDAAFGQRRKMLRGALSAWPARLLSRANASLRPALIRNPRGEMLTVIDFARIAEQFS